MTEKGTSKEEEHQTLEVEEQDIEQSDGDEDDKESRSSQQSSVKIPVDCLKCRKQMARFDSH